MRTWNDLPQGAGVVIVVVPVMDMGRDYLLGYERRDPWSIG